MGRGNMPAAHYFLSDVVVRRDIHVGSFAGHAPGAVAVRKIPVPIVGNVAVVVKLRVVGRAEPQSSPDHAGGIVIAR